MPMLDVRIVGEPSGGAGPSLTRRLAEAAAEAIHATPGSVWLTVETLSLDDYAENSGGPQADSLPVYVKVSKLRVDGPDEMGPEAAALTSAIAAVVGRPEKCVRLFYQVLDRVALGGKLVG